MIRRIAVALLILSYLVCLALAPEGSLATLPVHAALSPPSLAHPLGTDDLGRDVLLALVQGGKTSLTVASGATVLTITIGLLFGLLAALGPPIVDEATMRFGEVVASLPSLLLAVLVASLFGGSTWNLLLVIGLTRWPMIARVVRAETLALAEREFVRAAWALGATPTHVARVHIIPYLLPVIFSGIGIVFGGAVLTEAALAFVGLNDPQATSWGQMMAHGFALIGLAWWVWLWPVVALTLFSGLAALAFSTDPQAHAGSASTRIRK